MVNKKLLTIYLNDHLAAEVAIVEVAKRCLASNKASPLGDFLEGLVRELETDRASLIEALESLGMRSSPVKQAAGWIAEKFGRLKPNGQLTGYSPLSRLIEIEGLCAGIEHKLSMWRSLQLVAGSDSRLRRVDFDSLIERAVAQRESLEGHRLDAANHAFLRAA